MGTKLIPSTEYSPIGRDERRHSTHVSTNTMQLILTARDARGCTVRGAEEMLIRLGWVTGLKHGFFEAIPKDAWIDVICDVMGIDIFTLAKKILAECEKKGLTKPVK